jgi:hypothetical protein
MNSKCNSNISRVYFVIHTKNSEEPFLSIGDDSVTQPLLLSGSLLSSSLFYGSPLYAPMFYASPRSTISTSWISKVNVCSTSGWLASSVTVDSVTSVICTGTTVPFDAQISNIMPS